MKQEFLHLKLLTVFGVCGLNSSAQQLFTNLEWELGNGNPGTHSYVSSKLDPNGNLVYISNHKPGTNSDIFLNCIHSTGSVAWQTICPSSPTMDDYGTGVVTDATGNLFVCAARSNGSNLDYWIAKYSASGTLIWQKIYNGPANQNDAPAGIKLNSSGDVFVTGTSFGIGTSMDYATLKLNGNTGAIQWTRRYNFNNNPDVATDIAIDNAGNIVVCGASATNLLNSDFCILKYNTSGTLLHTRRHATPGIGYDLPTEMVVDASNNVFVVGSSNNGNAKDIKLLALNSLLTVSWVRYINYNNREDQGLGITLDPSNQIIITGFGSKIGGGTDIITAKYNPTTGTQTWNRVKKAPIETDIAKGKKVKTDISGNIYVAAEAEINSTRDFVTFSYTPVGELRWEQIFNNPNNGDDFAEQLIVANDKVYVTGTNKVGTTSKTTTVKYSLLNVSVVIVTNSGDTPVYKNHEMIISFNPSVVNSSFVNNMQRRFADIQDVIDDSTLVKMSEAIGIDFTTNKRIKLIKIFPTLTQEQTISISRIGDTIQIPAEFWASFRTILPESVDIPSAADSLSGIFPDINYAEPNWYLQLDIYPNDPSYVAGEQAGLRSLPAWPNNPHINMPPAWDIEVGDPAIKVGIYDTGIEYRQSDFKYGPTVIGSLVNTKIAGLWDYTINGGMDPFNPYAPDVNGHGTACSGIIGALSNNNKLIAGIAGGDFAASNFGVSLYGMRIIGNLSEYGAAESLLASDAANAIFDGAKSVSSGGLGLHIMNMSWGVNSSHSDLNLIGNQIKFSAKNNVVMSCSRGNSSNTSTHYPACFYDPLVLNVGASNANALLSGSSSYGVNLDFVAPGTANIVTTLDNYPPDSTRTFGGTSAAAPHVAGVAALMLSHVNTHPNKPNNLANEDVEQLLQIYADDVEVYGNPLYPTGYDDRTGWGKINAGEVLSKIELPHYQVAHFHGIQNINASNLSFVHGPVYVTFIDPPPGVGTQIYVCNKYKMTIMINHGLPPDATILNAWVRNNSSSLIAEVPNSGGSVLVFGDIKLESYNNNQAVLSGYIYHAYETLWGSAVNFWVPVNLGYNAHFAYTLHYFSPTIGIDEQGNTENIVVYPNPANNQVYIKFSDKDCNSATISVTDINGRTVSANTGINSTNQIVLNTSEYSTGVYIIKISFDDNTMINKKVVISR